MVLRVRENMNGAQSLFREEHEWCSESVIGENMNGTQSLFRGEHERCSESL